MAKALALEGGIGFVHRGMSIDAQVREIEQVKRSHGFVVEEPFTIPKGTRLRDARELMRRQGTSLLIEEDAGGGVLAGILSARDVPWFDGLDERPVSEFMTPFERLETGRPGVSLEDAEQILYRNRIEKLPLVDEDGRLSFPSDDAPTLVFEEDLLTAFLAQTRQLSVPAEAPSDLVSRELRVGDVFAVRARAPLTRVLEGEAEEPPRPVIPTRWLSPPIHDVTPDARDAAKLAYYAAAAALLPESTIEVELAEQLQPDRYDVLGPLEGSSP
jgi:CBS domain-containing protein